jgi:segregation and condensation protein B
MTDLLPENLKLAVETTEVSAIDFAQDLRIVEALLFASAEPMSLAAVVQQLGDGVDAQALIHRLKEIYAPRGVNLVETDGFWGFRTASDLAGQLKLTRQPRRKLPRAAAEVLAIIAYHQPVTRADIESIRGVETSKGTLDILLELGWIRPGKRRDTPGRPLTWQTTTDFLSHFNLETLRDLPGVDELKAAGLLDARPVLANLPREDSDNDTASDVTEDEEFSAWISDQLDVEAAE